MEASVKHGFAQGAFNVNAVAQAKAAIQVHEMFRSAAILQGADLANGFMGGRCDFMNATLEDKKKGAENIAGAVKKYGEDSPIPIVLHLDHGRDFDSCAAAIAGGYTSVMIDGSSLAFDENVELTREVVKYAHARGVSVEGELGVLAGVEDYVAHHARYGPEVRQNLTGALELRAETMTSGALGRVFADPFGMTAKQLLTVPTVLELADFSEEATAFLMNILMFRFQSYLQRLPESSALQRLIVLEEAHNVFRKTDAEDSALARSNLAFDKMFAEIRASGTGLVLSDQRPSLMPDSVMANTAVKLCLGMDSGEDRGCMGSVMDLSVLQRRALHAFRPGECLMTVRGTHGVFHLQTEKPGTSGSFTAACLVCGSRFRCRKSAVQGLLAPLDAGQMQYHLARIRADPYNIPVLAENIEQMLQQLRITAAAPTKLCLLGEMLAGAGVPLGESRQIVTAYHNHLKGGTV